MMPFIVLFFLKVFIWQGSPTRLNSGTGRDRNNGLTVSLPSSQIISPNKSVMFSHLWIKRRKKI
jgi:hypothetical protein